MILGGSAAIVLNRGPGLILLIAAVLGLIAGALYIYDVMRLYQTRRRRVIELNSKMVIPAMASLVLAVLLIASFLGMQQLSQHIGAVVFLIAFGWLSGLGLATLYKIAPFVTWLECYGPVLGKAVTPRVQDLVNEHRARKWFVLYFLGVWGAMAALLVDAT